MTGTAADSITPPDAAATALAVRDVQFRYRANGPTVVDNVSATLAPGKVTCLLGPNAAGKSTLVKLMLGQLEPLAGAITVAGEPVASLPAARRARWLSYVPQRGGVQFAFTVREVVAMGRFAAGTSSAGQAIDAALIDCDLLDVADRVFAELSGGQQQRVLIARAMAQSTGEGRAMLLDEPGSHLDLRHLHALMQLMRRQAKRGLAVLVVLHDLNLAARYADAVWLMDHGKMVAEGPWHAVLRPDVLTPVYGLKLEALSGDEDDDGRPVFRVTGVR
ncbi:ABC transporter ATP-binding protein [Phycisphaerales bacterium AB-hyl4]|uniref:ABC transporter ATP-binding protein n=1 Tax=Natronomicrosphaera hydrolytica TaxID=3242702 RepID=A0ABV4U6E6_9BACT